MYVPGEPLLSFSMKGYAAVEKHDSLYHDTFIQSVKTVLFRFADAHLVSRGLHLIFLGMLFPRAFLGHEWEMQIMGGHSGFS